MSRWADAGRTPQRAKPPSATAPSNTGSPLPRQSCAGSERLEDWKAHVESVVGSLEPEGYVETELATRIAEILWRLRRVGHYEAEVISVTLDDMPEMYAELARYGEKVTGTPARESPTPERIDMQVGVRMLPDPDTLGKIMRYEAHLHRQLTQTMHELEAMQSRRKGEHSPLARLDISGPPGP